MKITLRDLLLFVSGGIFCFALGAGVDVFWKLKHPLGAFKNSDYNLVQVANRWGDHLFDLHKGESKFLEYGVYKIKIPDARLSVTMWKNNRGFCDFHSSNGALVLVTDGDCGLGEIQ